MTETADVVVLGMGPGGEAAGNELADAGLDVIGIDERLLGGECPYFGCVPSKMMIRAANLLTEARRIPGMAGSVDLRSDWAPVAKRIRDEATDNWDDKVAVERFEGKGGRFVRGTGRLVAPNQVAVGDDVYEASRAVIVATGTAPAVPPVEGLADTPYWTNRDIIQTEEVPSSLVVMGGGAIGLELSQVFSRFGSDVTVVEALDRLLPPEEPEAGELLARVFEEEGITVRTSAKVAEVQHRDGRFALQIDGGGEVAGERLLVATGRHIDLAAIGAEVVGVDAKARSIDVDDHLRVVPGVYALGDITGIGPFTHVAVYQAHIAVADILGRDVEPADYRGLSRVTFTDPEIGSVGLNERAARDKGLNVRTGFADVPKSARGWIHKAGNDGFIKLVEDADRGILVGASSAGPVGGEVLSMLTLAVHAEVPTAQLGSMIYAYPTFHRTVEAAVKKLTG